MLFYDVITKINKYILNLKVYDSIDEILEELYNIILIESDFDIESYFEQKAYNEQCLSYN